MPKEKPSAGKKQTRQTTPRRPRAPGVSAKRQTKTVPKTARPTRTRRTAKTVQSDSEAVIIPIRIIPDPGQKIPGVIGNFPKPIPKREIRRKAREAAQAEKARLAAKARTNKKRAKTRAANKAKAARDARTGLAALVPDTHIPRPVRNVLASAIVLFVLIVGAGVAYTYYIGRNVDPSKVMAIPAASTMPVAIKPQAVRPNAPESASVELLSSPVSPGDEASLSVKTLPDSICGIIVSYNKTKVPSAAAGLIPHTADDFGTVNWSWIVDATAPSGTWPVTVTCLHNKNSAVVVGDIVVVQALSGASVSN